MFGHVDDDVFQFVFFISKDTVKNARMPDCPASSQSGTGMKKTNGGGNGPVPD